MSSRQFIEDANFTTREFDFLNLPIDESFKINHPEKVMLRFGSNTFDIGALCFSKRSNEDRVPFQTRLVDVSSLDPARLVVIERLIRAASLLSDKFRPLTLEAILNHFKNFADYCDEQKLDQFLDCGINSEKAFVKFANYIFDRFKQDNIGATRGLAIQSHVLMVFKAIGAAKSFGSEVRLINTKGERLRKETLPAGQDDFSHLLAMTHMLFNGLSDLLLNNSPFPFKLDLPGSLNWPSGNYLWLFPTHIWYLPPRMWGECRNKKYRPGWMYDYENGCFKSVDDIWQHYNGVKEMTKKHRAAQSLKLSKKLLEAANSDSKHYRRLHFAKLAFNCFIFLFFANTGVNPSVLVELETEEDIDASVINQSYRAIKYRANGKMITVRVPVSFMPDLRKFMALRKFILNEIKCSLLFFRFSRFDHSSEKIKSLSLNPLENLFVTLEGIDPRISGIKPRQIRATLNDWYLRNHEVPVVAKIMGHSEETENKKYGRGSPKDHQEEMTNFLQGVATIAKTQKISTSRSELRGSKILEQGGGCNDFGNPVSLEGQSRFQPDCKNNCWFCSKRQLVTDEIDVRKIASAIFVMERFIQGPVNEQLLRPFIKKCESDLDQIALAGSCKAMVDRVKGEVFKKGRLSSYWAGKFNLYMDLGVIT